MKSLLASKRSKAILGIGIVAIGIGAISKKVISYPAGGCMKGAQEMTFNKETNNYFIWGIIFFSLMRALVHNFMATVNL